MKIDDHLKLIDFDASCQISIDYVTNKYSSGYLPPELFYMKDGLCLVRSANEEDIDLRVIAMTSIDSWALGVVLYLLFSKCDLFAISRDGNINRQDEDFLI